MTIAILGTGDAYRLVPLLDDAFDPAYGEAWTVAQCDNSLLLPGVFCLVHMDNERVTAFALLQHIGDEAELLLLAVDAALRQLGVGSQLLQHAEQEVVSRGGRRLFLEVRDNNPARHFYSERGFLPIGRRQDYYKAVDGQRVDAVTMEKILD